MKNEEGIGIGRMKTKRRYGFGHWHVDGLCLVLLGFGSAGEAADFKATEALAAKLPSSAATLSASLLEPGTGNDEPARRALHGLAIWLGANGTEAQRMAFATALEAAGERSGVGADVKWFLREQLKWARATVPTIRRPGGAADRTLDSADFETLKAASLSTTGFDGTAAMAEVFWAVDGWALEGPADRSRAAAWYRGYWLGAGESGPGHLRCVSLNRLAGLDPAAAVKLLRDGLVDARADVSACAESVAIRIPGAAATSHFVALAANRREDADLRALAVKILGARGDAAALAAVRRALVDSSEDVRVAAIGAIAALGGAKAVPDLLAKLGRTWTGEAKAAADALPRIVGMESALAAGFEAAGPAGKTAILNALAARVATLQLPLALRAADDADPGVAAAGLAAVGVLGGAAELDGLIGRVTSAPDDDRREAAVGAFVAIVKRMKDKDAAASLVTAKLPAAVGATRSALLSLLPKVGGAPALAVARADLGHTEVGVREAAVRALAEWPDAGPLEELLAIACAGPDADHRILAVRGAIKLAEKLDGTAGAKAGRLANAYGLCATPADRRQALAALGRTPHPLALAVARFAERDATVRGEALAAITRIARGIASHRPGEARAALEFVLAAQPADAVRKRANDGLDDLKARAGFLTAWEISDPYGRDGLPDDRLLDTPFDPETAPAKVSWRPVEHDDESDDPQILDFKKVHDVDHRAAYIRTTVTIPKQGSYRLEVGSDDGVKVWVDGKLLHTNNTPRGVECGEDKIPVTLGAGKHDLLLKVANGEGGWGACVALKSSAGRAVPGLTAEIDLP